MRVGERAGMQMWTASTKARHIQQRIALLDGSAYLWRQSRPPPLPTAAAPDADTTDASCRCRCRCSEPLIGHGDVLRLRLYHTHAPQIKSRKARSVDAASLRMYTLRVSAALRLHVIRVTSRVRHGEHVGAGIGLGGGAGRHVHSIALDILVLARPKLGRSTQTATCEYGTSRSAVCAAYISTV